MWGGSSYISYRRYRSYRSYSSNSGNLGNSGNSSSISSRSSSSSRDCLVQQVPQTARGRRKGGVRERILLEAAADGPLRVVAYSRCRLVVVMTIRPKLSCWIVFIFSTSLLRYYMLQLTVILLITIWRCSSINFLLFTWENVRFYTSITN